MAEPNLDLSLSSDGSLFGGSSGQPSLPKGAPALQLPHNKQPMAEPNPDLSLSSDGSLFGGSSDQPKASSLTGRSSQQHIGLDHELGLSQPASHQKSAAEIRSDAPQPQYPQYSASSRQEPNPDLSLSSDGSLFGGSSGQPKASSLTGKSSQQHTGLDYELGLSQPASHQKSTAEIRSDALQPQYSQYSASAVLPQRPSSRQGPLRESTSDSDLLSDDEDVALRTKLKKASGGSASPWAGALESADPAPSISPYRGAVNDSYTTVNTNESTAFYGGMPPQRAYSARPQQVLNLEDSDAGSVDDLDSPRVDESYEPARFPPRGSGLVNASVTSYGVTDSMGSGYYGATARPGETREVYSDDLDEGEEQSDFYDSRDYGPAQNQWGQPVSAVRFGDTQDAPQAAFRINTQVPQQNMGAYSNTYGAGPGGTYPGQVPRGNGAGGHYNNSQMGQQDEYDMDGDGYESWEGEVMEGSPTSRSEPYNRRSRAVSRTSPKTSPPKRPPYNKRDRHPSEWDVKDVCEWVSELGMPQYQFKFRHHSITGKTLLTLQEKHLLHDLAIGPLGHRREMLAGIKALVAEAEKTTSAEMGGREKYSLPSPPHQSPSPPRRPASATSGVIPPDSHLGPAAGKTSPYELRARLVRDLAKTRNKTDQQKNLIDQLEHMKNLREEEAARLRGMVTTLEQQHHRMSAKAFTREVLDKDANIAWQPVGGATKAFNPHPERFAHPGEPQELDMTFNPTIYHKHRTSPLDALNSFIEGRTRKYNKETGQLIKGRESGTVVESVERALEYCDEIIEQILQGGQSDVNYTLERIGFYSSDKGTQQRLRQVQKLTGQAKLSAMLEIAYMVDFLQRAFTKEMSNARRQKLIAIAKRKTAKKFSHPWKPSSTFVKPPRKAPEPAKKTADPAGAELDQAVNELRQYFQNKLGVELDGVEDVLGAVDEMIEELVEAARDLEMKPRPVDSEGMTPEEKIVAENFEKMQRKERAAEARRELRHNKYLKGTNYMVSAKQLMKMRKMKDSLKIVEASNFVRMVNFVSRRAVRFKEGDDDEDDAPSKAKTLPWAPSGPAGISSPHFSYHAKKKPKSETSLPPPPAPPSQHDNPRVKRCTDAAQVFDKLGWSANEEWDIGAAFGRMLELERGRKEEIKKGLQYGGDDWEERRYEPWQGVEQMINCLLDRIMEYKGDLEDFQESASVYSRDRNRNPEEDGPPIQQRDDGLEEMMQAEMDRAWNEAVQKVEEEFQEKQRLRRGQQRRSERRRSKYSRHRPKSRSLESSPSRPQTETSRKGSRPSSPNRRPQTPYSTGKLHSRPTTPGRRPTDVTYHVTRYASREHESSNIWPNWKGWEAGRKKGDSGREDDTLRRKQPPPPVDYLVKFIKVMAPMTWEELERLRDKLRGHHKVIAVARAIKAREFITQHEADLMRRDRDHEELATYFRDRRWAHQTADNAVVEDFVHRQYEDQVRRMEASQRAIDERLYEEREYSRPTWVARPVPEAFLKTPGRTTADSGNIRQDSVNRSLRQPTPSSRPPSARAPSAPTTPRGPSTPRASAPTLQQGGTPITPQRRAAVSQQGPLRSGATGSRPQSPYIDPSRVSPSSRRPQGEVARSAPSAVTSATPAGSERRQPPVSPQSGGRSVRGSGAEGRSSREARPGIPVAKSVAVPAARGSQAAAAIPTRQSRSRQSDDDIDVSEAVNQMAGHR